MTLRTKLKCERLLDELEYAWQPGTSHRKRQPSDIIQDLITEVKKLPVIEEGEN